MKVLKFELKNFKLLDDISVDTNGMSVMVTGPNETGKSSILDAIFDLLSNGDLPPNPIKIGEDNASITVEVGEERTQYIIKRTFTEAKKEGYLTIETPDGAKYGKPVEHLEKLFGTISFDMEGLLNAKNNKEMIKKLKEFLCIDTTILDSERKEFYDARTLVNKEVLTLQALVKDPKDVPALTKDLQELENKRATQAPIKIEINELEARIKNGEEYISKREKLISTSESDLGNCERVIKDTEISIVELKTEMEAIAQKIANKEAEITKQKSLIDQTVSYINTIKEEKKKGENQMQELRDALKEKTGSIENEEVLTIKISNIEAELKAEDENNIYIKKLEAKNRESLELTDKIKEIDKKISDLYVAASTEELQITSEEILYKNLPLDRKQINTASLAKLALKLVMKSNPKLRSVRFDASFMDNKTFRETMTDIEAEGFQSFVEMVDKEGQELQIIVKESLI